MATALIDPAMGHADALKTELIAGTYTCGSDTQSTGNDGSEALLTASAGAMQDSNTDECVESIDLVLRVTRDGSSADTTVRPVQ